jgi:hypothetical protein
MDTEKLQKQATLISLMQLMLKRKSNSIEIVVFMLKEGFVLA